jgi:hypothetical protein
VEEVGVVYGDQGESVWQVWRVCREWRVAVEKLGGYIDPSPSVSLYFFKQEGRRFVRQCVRVSSAHAVLRAGSSLGTGRFHLFANLHILLRRRYAARLGLGRCAERIPPGFSWAGAAVEWNGTAGMYLLAHQVLVRLPPPRRVT